MADRSPSSDLVARFEQDVWSLAPNFDRIGLAVSGGPDSLALLLLAHAAFPRRVAAATVDHGLRAGSDQEVRFVARLCAELEVPHASLRAEVDRQAASLQQSARRARYAALADWLQADRIRLLATAHHADDQAETLLMRLLRGASAAGLAGVRARTAVPVLGTDLQLIRPLLGWRKEELRALIEHAGIQPVDDTSNRDLRFDRSRVRAQLADSDWLDPAALARSATALAEADDALNWATQAEYKRRVREDGPRLLFDHQGLPRELKRRTVRAILAAFEPAAAPRGPEIERLLAKLEQESAATLAGIKCVGGVNWTFERAPPRRSGK